MLALLRNHGVHLDIRPLCVPAHSRRQFGIFEGTHSVGTPASFYYPVLTSCVFWNTHEARGWLRAKKVCMIESPASLIRTHTKYIREAPPVLKTHPAGMKRFFIAAATLYAPTLDFFCFFLHFFFIPDPKKYCLGGFWGRRIHFS